MVPTDTTSLAGALDEQRYRSHERIPDDALQVMQQSTDDLKEQRRGEDALHEGDAAPSFALPNAVGRTVRLEEALAEGPVVLSFYRGGWCPYCNLELRALQDRLPDIQAQGAQLLTVSPQTPDASLSTAEKHDLDFEVLSDAGNTVARRYGLVFQLSADLRDVYDDFGIELPAANGDESHELPIPATFVLDTSGVVRYAFVDPDYTKRAAPDDVIAALQSL